MEIESTCFCICSSRPAGKESCDSRETAMRRLDDNIKRARAAEGSAGMLHNGVWELHFPNKAMVLSWVEDSNGDVQRFP